MCSSFGYSPICQWTFELLLHLAIVNNATTNLGMQIPVVQIPASQIIWGIYLEDNLLDHMVILFLVGDLSFSFIFLNIIHQICPFAWSFVVALLLLTLFE